MKVGRLQIAGQLHGSGIVFRMGETVQYVRLCRARGDVHHGSLKFCDNGFSAQGKRCQRRGEDVEGFPFGNAVSYFLSFHTKKILKLAKIIQLHGQNMPEGVFCQP